jgi:hypothetical protein
MSIDYRSSGGSASARPSYWSTKCVDTVQLPKALDPHAQKWDVSSGGFDRASCNGAAMGTANATAPANRRANGQ